MAGLYIIYVVLIISLNILPKPERLRFLISKNVFPLELQLLMDEEIVPLPSSIEELKRTFSNSNYIWCQGTPSDNSEYLHTRLRPSAAAWNIID